MRSLWDEVRHPEHKAFSVAEMLEQEHAEPMPMPTDFDGYVERSAKVSSTCLVAVARNRYSVPCELAGRRVSTRLYPGRVEIATWDEVIVARHERLPNRGHICYDWQHYITLIQRKPGALSTEHVLNVLARLSAVEPPPNVRSTLDLKEAPLADTGRYDRLRGDAMEEISHA